MKTIGLFGLLVLAGGIGGAAYAEFDRVTSASRNAREHVFQITRVYIRDQKTAESAVSDAVKKCTRELYFVDFPPVLTAFLTDNAIVDYKIVRKYGSSAHKQKNEIEDLRNALSAEYYDPISEELDSLESTVLERSLTVMKDYNNNRTKMSRCIHENAFVNLNGQGQIES